MDRYQKKEFIDAEPMWKAEYRRKFKKGLWGAADVPGYHIRFIESGRDEWRDEESFLAQWEKVE